MQTKRLRKGVPLLCVCVCVLQFIVFKRQFRPLKDLREIWIHLAKESEEYADRIAIQILGVPRKLTNLPKMGKQRNELIFGLRSFPAGKYLIFYQETKNGISIVRVLHSARDIDNLF